MKCKTCGQEVQENTTQTIPEKKLEWGATGPEKLSWEQAKLWCEEQGKGWRLPEVDELFKAYLDKVPGFGTGVYWSAAENSDANARLVFLNDGSVNSYNKANYYSVRCVRTIK